MAEWFALRKRQPWREWSDENFCRPSHFIVIVGEDRDPIRRVPFYVHHRFWDEWATRVRAATPLPRVLVNLVSCFLPCDETVDLRAPRTCPCFRVRGRLVWGASDRLRLYLTEAAEIDAMAAREGRFTDLVQDVTENYRPVSLLRESAFGGTYIELDALPDTGTLPVSGQCGGTDLNAEICFSHVDVRRFSTCAYLFLVSWTEVREGHRCW